MYILDNLSVNKDGNLTFAGLDTVSLAKKYSTPLYLMDENKIRRRCREYIEALNKYFKNAKPLYASKAASFKRIYEIVKEENMSVDVVSAGEFYTALKAGFPSEKVYFHGNNKSLDEIDFAIKNKIGYFIVDNLYELGNVNEIAGKYGIKQKILLRITPGIDPHTYEAVSTGKVDCKFGSAIETGQALEIVKEALKCENLELEGYHCHIGSMVFEHTPFSDSAKVMLKFIADVKKETGYVAKTLNLGGGFGVRYVESDPELNIDECIKNLADVVKNECKRLDIDEPTILMEPGRSIVGDCGITLYTVGAIKEITGYKKYVAIDGGMSDNPRYALYGAEHSAIVANKVTEDKDYKCTIAGKCCESGDLIQEDIFIQTPQSGDILAVLSTGAYNYSMASNYNKIPRPPIVMIHNGEDYVAVKRENFEDLIKNEL